MKQFALAIAATLFTLSGACADPQSDYLAMSVSTMQAANAKCGFGLSDAAILSASAQLGAQPSDPSFVASVAQQRAAFEANLASMPADMVPDICRDTRQLLTQLGL